MVFYQELLVPYIAPYILNTLIINRNLFRMGVLKYQKLGNNNFPKIGKNLHRVTLIQDYSNIQV